MKNVYITVMIVTWVFMLILPICSGISDTDISVAAKPSGEIKDDTAEQKRENVKVRLTETQETITLSLEDYIFGVVAAEMPALYETEALKAQAVAAYTYFLVQKPENGDKDYDITDNFAIDQAFITKEKAREKWGDGADEYENRILSAVRSVLYKKVTYNGSAASTVYHAISYGVTEPASEVWGGDYPYLVSVDSSWDKLSDKYLVDTVFTAEEIKTALSSLAEISDTSVNCIGNITRTAAGGVKTIEVAGKSLTGSQLRSALGLRSANFEVSFSEGRYTFTTYGYGHSIGMSQYGAHYMAMQGKNYEEILLHYYSGCKIE